MEFRTRKTALLGLFSTIALAIFMVESMLPPIAPIPGIKLGLANVVTLFVLIKFSARDAALVLFVRIIMTAIFAGQAIYLLYSLFGGILSFITMIIINRLLQNKLIYLTSILGAIAHNTGQILAAFFVLNLNGIFAYLPYLAISGIITGLFTGIVCHLAVKKISINF